MIWWIKCTKYPYLWICVSAYRIVVAHAHTRATLSCLKRVPEGNARCSIQCLPVLRIDWWFSFFSGTQQRDPPMFAVCNRIGESWQDVMGCPSSGQWEETSWKQKTPCGMGWPLLWPWEYCCAIPSHFSAGMCEERAWQMSALLGVGEEGERNSTLWPIVIINFIPRKSYYFIYFLLFTSRGCALDHSDCLVRLVYIDEKISSALRTYLIPSTTERSVVCIPPYLWQRGDG